MAIELTTDAEKRALEHAACLPSAVLMSCTSSDNSVYCLIS